MTKVLAEDFIRIWQRADSVEEVSQKTGLNNGAVMQRAKNYRKKGVPLKKFKTGSHGNDWARLAALAEDALK